MGASPTIPEQYANQQVGISGYRVLNLDLDGVCADYAGAMRDYLVRTGCSYPGNIASSSLTPPNGSTTTTSLTCRSASPD